MVLVLVKNFLFPSSPPLSPPLSPRKAPCSPITAPSETTTLLSRPSTSSTDLEAQCASRTSRWPRIDARVVSDATIGLSDGLTVPFALTAGLSALGNTRVVIYGGLAELIAGAISMGLGGYLGAKSEL